MLKFSKKIDYGLILLSKLCYEPAPASAREMAESHHLPQPMVANILKALTAGGILTSTRGAQGGYVLARSPRVITLAQVIDALEGPFSLVDCVADNDNCDLTDSCPTHSPLQAVHLKFQAFMENLTLGEILAGETPLSFRKFDNEKTYLPG